MDYAFHFYGWWQDPINTLEPEGVAIGAEDLDDFAKVEGEMTEPLGDGR